jgi:hypothetical protein
MKYNLADQSQSGLALNYLLELIKKQVIVDIKKISPKRSLQQNKYLHVLLGAFGQKFGYTLDEAKTVYKRDINPELYVYQKNNSMFLKSSTELSKEEMAKSIDRFREKSAELGYPLPPATDKEWLMQIENEAERTGYYL